MELIDSSEFHGSPEKELLYYNLKIKHFLENKRLIKIIIYIILWFIGGRIGINHLSFKIMFSNQISIRRNLCGHLWILTNIFKSRKERIRHL